MPTAFCALEDAYGDWGKKPVKSKEDSAKNINTNKNNNDKEIVKKEWENSYSGSENANDIRSFCPNCQNCLNANNMLQQKIIEQNIWPRPRWIPQNPTAYEMHDPYNRYWMDHSQNQNHREDFGNINHSFGSPFNLERFGNEVSRSEGLLQLILFVLVCLFIIQLFEMIFRMTGKSE